MRVVVEVDVELGLTRVVWIGTAQDVGKALNPQAVEGQIEGGTAQGLGLALMEEIQTRDGADHERELHRLPDPDGLDMPPVVSELVEDPEPDAPYGVKGVGEPPTVVSTAAIVAALRDATGRELAARARAPRRHRRALSTSQRGASRPPLPPRMDVRSELADLRAERMAKRSRLRDLHEVPLNRDRGLSRAAPWRSGRR